jgi:hypothetical protein
MQRQKFLYRLKSHLLVRKDEASYFDFGLKLKSATQIKEEYPEIVSTRLSEIGLEIPAAAHIDDRLNPIKITF